MGRLRRPSSCRRTDVDATKRRRIDVISTSCARWVFSSPEPKAPGELIGWEGSVVRLSSVRRPSTISNDFSSETNKPIATKFHIQPPGPLGKKSCSNGLGHMTNMAAMPIYGKNLKKSSSPEPLHR